MKSRGVFTDPAIFDNFDFLRVSGNADECQEQGQN